MGRIKIKAIKSLAHEILKTNEGKFVEDFDKNKQALAGIMSIESKKTRNVIAGYITKEMKRKNKPPVVPPPAESQSVQLKTDKRRKRQ